MARAGRRVSGERVAIALGSNLGDRAAHLSWALAALAGSIDGLRASPFTETAPVDVPEPQPDYLNAVAIGRTTLAPHRLLDVLLALEAERGRIRTGWHAARTLDLDLVLYGEAIVHDARLDLPHPRFLERPFVLGPLARLAPDWREPHSGRTLAELWNGKRPAGEP
jgi:2-amino-4-hydroxy-6-hydroxymethyldihydropteridine diphosphokinase